MKKEVYWVCSQIGTEPPTQTEHYEIDDANRVFKELAKNLIDDIKRGSVSFISSHNGVLSSIVIN